MLGIFEAEAVGYLGNGFPCRQAVLGKLDDELADVVARRVAGGFLDDIAKIIGRHTELVGAILHGRQAEGQLEFVLKIVAQQTVEADEDVGVLNLSGNKLSVVEPLAEVERQFDISPRGWRSEARQVSLRVPPASGASVRPGCRAHHRSCAGLR